MNLASLRMSKEATVVSVCEWNRKELSVQLSISALMLDSRLQWGGHSICEWEEVGIEVEGLWALGEKGFKKWGVGVVIMSNAADEWMKSERWETGESKEEVFWGALLERETEKWKVFYGDHLRSREFFCLFIL